ncbi:MAG: sigma-70 family RNA polymerase sigma factor [Culicoidibacterales bacterium]
MQKVNYNELFYLANDGNEFAYNELVETYIQNYKNFFYNEYAKNMDYDNFYSTMYFAVSEGIAGYDPYGGASIQTYLQSCVRNKLITNNKNEQKRVKTVYLEPEILGITQHQQAPTKSIGDVCFKAEYREFVESLTAEQKLVFEEKLAGKSARLIAEEQKMSRSKLRQIEEKLKTKAKIYGLIEKSC